jgi:hypothetical protein
MISSSASADPDPSPIPTPSRSASSGPTAPAAARPSVPGRSAKVPNSGQASSTPFSSTSTLSSPSSRAAIARIRVTWLTRPSRREGGQLLRRRLALRRRAGRRRRGSPAPARPARRRSRRTGERAASAGSWVMTSRVAPAAPRAARTAGRGSPRRWRCRDCRSARRRAARPGAARWRGRSPRAAARRPTIAPDNGEPVAQPDRLEFGRARSKASLAPASSSGTATFSSAVIVGSNWKAWRTIPIRPAGPGQPSSSSAVKSAPAIRIVPPLARSSPTSTAISDDFPAPRRPEQGNAFAARDLKVDAAQYLDPARAGAERQRDIRSVDTRCC